MHRDRETADADPLQPDGDRIEEAEQQAGRHGVPGTPLAEHQCRQRHEALARAHVGDELGGLGHRQVGAADAGQQAADDERCVAHAHHRDTGGIDRCRCLAHRPQAQAEAGTEQHPPGQRHGGERHVLQQGVAAQQLAVELANDRHVIQLLGIGQVDGGEAGRAGQRRGLTALIEPVTAQGDGQAGRQDVDGHAAHHLITAVGDGGKAVHQGEQDGDTHPGTQPNPGRAGDGCRCRAGERRRQQLALQGDVDHPGALAEHAGHGRQDQRWRGADGGIQHQDQNFKHDQAPLTCAAERLANAR